MSHRSNLHYHILISKEIKIAFFFSLWLLPFSVPSPALHRSPISSRKQLFLYPPPPFFFHRYFFTWCITLHYGHGCLNAQSPMNYFAPQKYEIFFFFSGIKKITLVLRKKIAYVTNIQGKKRKILMKKRCISHFLFLIRLIIFFLTFV